MKVVILAGGLGTRLGEESKFKPKPMVTIGGMPIIWHIMKEYSYYGYNEFIICAGYLQHVIKEWFSHYMINQQDVTFDFRETNEGGIFYHDSHLDPWIVTVVDTGMRTNTGGRIRRIQKYVKDETFLMTYGDGVCDVEIDKLVKFHKENKRIATLTAVKRVPKKGIVDIGGDNAVKSFREKNITDSMTINAGYMAFEKEIFDYLDGDETVLEQSPMERLAEEGQLTSYLHEGFWQCMDNVREREQLESLIEKGEAPWVRW